jgi:hypothetical protein
MEVVPKDVYLLIATMQENKDIIQMLSVNRKYNDTVFFEQILRKKYPHLIKYKKVRESWKQFYVRMVYYLSYLKEEYDIPYVNVASFDPIVIYIYLKRETKGKKVKEKKIIASLIIAAEVGETQDKNLINKLIEKGGNRVIYSIFLGICKSGNLELFKFYEKQVEDLYAEIEPLITNSVISGNKNMIDYIANKVGESHDPNKIVVAAMSGALQIGNFAAFKSYDKMLKVPEKEKRQIYNFIFEYAVRSKKINVIKSFVKQRGITKSPILEEIFNLVIYGHTDNDLEILKFLIGRLIIMNKSRDFMSELLPELYKNVIDKDILAYLHTLEI